MTPVDFVGTNANLKAPPGTADWCDDLPVQRHGGGCTSMWMPNAEELARLVAGQPVQLTIQGETHPPVFVTVGRAPDEVRDVNRCGACGWPLAKTTRDGCTRGNCSERPLPAEAAMYDAARYSKEQQR